jgi:ADP-ribose pyrophosphatase
MTVREDEVARPDGSTGIFGVVEKPDFALVIPYDGNGFYAVEQYRYPVEGSYVEFPQGSWEGAAVADPLDLARAELAEETGIRAGTMDYLGHLFEAYGYCTQGFHVFLATDLAQGEQALTSEEADLRVSYLTEGEFCEHVLSGRIKDAPTLAAFALMQLRTGPTAR